MSELEGCKIITLSQKVVIGFEILPMKGMKGAYTWEQSIILLTSCDREETCIYINGSSIGKAILKSCVAFFLASYIICLGNIVNEDLTVRGRASA